jgi:catechol 2,3-dioxygenase-like lactoylglutathione lyase family enzyme
VAPKFTRKQGEYLAFIDHYIKVHRRAPAEADLLEYFRVTPPSVHQMILTLEKKKLISRVPGEARSIRLLVRPEEIPPLGDHEKAPSRSSDRSIAGDFKPGEVRPAVAIGHVTLRVSDVKAAASFYVALGMRPIMERSEMAILELRGGTHLLLFRAKGRPRSGPVRSFDLMVDDVDAARADAVAHGLSPAESKDDPLGGHRYFEVSDPDGHVLSVYSSHVGHRPV